MLDNELTKYESMTKKELESIVQKLERKIFERLRDMERYAVNHTIKPEDQERLDADIALLKAELNTVNRILATKSGTPSKENVVCNISSDTNIVATADVDEINSMSLTGLEKFVRRLMYSIDLDSEKIIRFKESDDFDDGDIDYQSCLQTIEEYKTKVAIAKKRVSDLSNNTDSITEKSTESIVCMRKKTVMVLCTAEYPFKICKYVTDIESVRNELAPAQVYIDKVIISSGCVLEKNFESILPVFQLLKEIPSIEFIENSKQFVAFDAGAVSREELETFLEDNARKIAKLRLERIEKEQNESIELVCFYTELLEKDRKEVAKIQEELKRTAPKLYGYSLDEMIEMRKSNVVKYGDFTVDCDNFYDIKDPTNEDLLKMVEYCHGTFLLMDQTEELCKAVLCKIGHIMMPYIHNQTEEIIRFAIGLNYKALRYVREQTKDICMFALEKNPVDVDREWIIAHIRNPEILFEED